jgi:Integrase zinc binding domain
MGGFEVDELCVPMGKRKQIVETAHDSQWSAHFGALKTLQRIEVHFFWPGLKNDVDNYVSSCIACKRHRRVTKLDRVPIAQMQRVKVPFEHLFFGSDWSSATI